MKRRTISLLGTVTAAALLVQAVPAAADPPWHAGTRGYGDRADHDGWHHHDHDRARHRGYGYRAYDYRGYDREYYPRRGYIVERLPPRCREVHYHGGRYFYGSGFWYQPYGPQFVMVAPPMGLVVDSHGVHGYVAARFPVARW